MLQVYSEWKHYQMPFEELWIFINILFYLTSMERWFLLCPSSLSSFHMVYLPSILPQNIVLKSPLVLLVCFCPSSSNFGMIMSSTLVSRGSFKCQLWLSFPTMKCFLSSWLIHSPCSHPVSNLNDPGPNSTWMLLSSFLMFSHMLPWQYWNAHV